MPALPPAEPAPIAELPALPPAESAPLAELPALPPAEPAPIAELPPVSAPDFELPALEPLPDSAPPAATEFALPSTETPPTAVPSAGEFTLDPLSSAPSAIEPSTPAPLPTEAIAELPPLEPLLPPTVAPPVPTADPLTPTVIDAPIATVTPPPLPVDYTLLAFGGLGLLGLLGAGGFWLMRRRREEAGADEVEVMPSGALALSADDAAYLERSTADDPMERTDYLLAIGDYEQAEHTVREVLMTQLEDVAAMVKLLDVYFAANNGDAFIMEAEPLYDLLGDPNSPEWQHVCLMGRQLCPGFPMFEQSSDPSAIPLKTAGNAVDDTLFGSLFGDRPTVGQTTDFGNAFSELFGEPTQADADKPSAGGASLQKADDSSGFDFDFSAMGSDVPVGKPGDATQAFEFNFDELPEASVPSLKPSTDDLPKMPKLKPSAETDSFGFDFSDAPAPVAKAPTPDLKPASGGDFDFDFSDVPASADKAAPPGGGDFAFDFDEVPKPPTAPTPSQASAPADDSFAFDFSDVPKPPAAPTPSQASAPADDSFAFDFNEIPAAPKPPAAATPAADDADAFDFDLGDMDNLSAPVGEPTSDISMMDFGLSSGAKDAPLDKSFSPETVNYDPAQDAMASELESFDFALDQNLGDAEGKSPTGERNHDMDAFDFGSDFSMNTSDEDVSVLLEVGLSYADIDPSKARDLLDRVVEKGNPQQRQQAEKALQQL